MLKFRHYLPVVFLTVMCAAATVVAGSITFDQSQWNTGDMNEQYPSDSAGSITNSHVDHFYYRERLPMRMAVIDDSLVEGSSSRTYDSAVLILVVAADGLSGSDSMRVFGKRLTRDWSENGVSWSFYWASADSAWSTVGGDINSLPCMDTIIIDTSLSVNDTLVFHTDTSFVRYMVETDNFGWIMIAENIVDRATFQFYTEDIANEALRPVLTVYFTDGAQAETSPGRRRRIQF